MGRVYEALKRAAERGASPHDDNGNDSSNGVISREATTATVGNGNGDPVARVLKNSSVLRAAGSVNERLNGSASNERIEGGGVSPALSDAARASRVAGATLDAVGTTRARREFPTVEISPARVEPHLVSITQPRSPFCEQFRSLRTHVLHAGERKRMQTFVVSSAGVMEGKTVTAINLAWLLAQADGVRALLIDCDLRRPCSADYFGLEREVGLSEVLGDEATLDETIVRLEPAGLHLLPGGAARDDVADLLMGPKFASVLRELRGMFNYIIIDAPPLGIFTDATMLINRADAAILVVRSGRTRYAALDRIIAPLPQERILGVVLNGAEEKLDESNYYYQRRYYARRSNPNGERAGEEAVEEIEQA